MIVKTGECILAIFCIGWIAMFLTFIYEIHSDKFTEKFQGKDLNEYPIWIWMVLACAWPVFVWRVVSNKVKFAVCKAALIIASKILNERPMNNSNKETKYDE